MKTILAPTDFSATSLNAVDYAADLAVVTGNNLMLIHICPIPVSYGEVPLSASYMDDVVAGSEKQLLRLKYNLLTRTAEQVNISTRVEIGEVVFQLEEICSSVKPYAVVMGSEKNNVLERMLFGGKTIAALQRLSFPLIVVPPQISFHQIRKVGLACDFKNLEGTLPLDEIKMLVKELKASLYVLHVANHDSDSSAEERINESHWLSEMLWDVDSTFHIIYEHETEKAIIEYCESNKLDMLIVIPKKHDLLGKLLKHSYSKRLVLQAHLPVMVLHH
jgi:nucleotide-binding universal stress UspA family protein